MSTTKSSLGAHRAPRPPRRAPKFGGAEADNGRRHRGRPGVDRHRLRCRQRRRAHLRGRQSRRFSPTVTSSPWRATRDIGKLATITVRRGNTVIGSASHVVDEGDVAFEINHPGGACWGDGPDSRSRPTSSPATRPPSPSTARRTPATPRCRTPTPVDRLRRRRHHLHRHRPVGPDVNRSSRSSGSSTPPCGTPGEQARHPRCPGGLVRAAKGGYSSNLEFSGDTFTATYRSMTPTWRGSPPPAVAPGS